jgi:hypothetical protein
MHEGHNRENNEYNNIFGMGTFYEPILNRIWSFYHTTTRKTPTEKTQDKGHSGSNRTGNIFPTKKHGENAGEAVRKPNEFHTLNEYHKNRKHLASSLKLQ